MISAAIYSRKEIKMALNISRPKLIAKHSIIPLFTWWKILFGIAYIPLHVLLFFVFKALLPRVVDLSSDLLSFTVTVLLTLIAGSYFTYLLIRFICKVVILRCIYYEFYEGYVITKWGVFHKYEKRSVFPLILSCYVDRKFEGRIFRYGDVKLDTVAGWDLEPGDTLAKYNIYPIDKREYKDPNEGRWDIKLKNIKNPLQIRKYIHDHFVPAQDVNAMRETFISQSNDI